MLAAAVIATTKQKTRVNFELHIRASVEKHTDKIVSKIRINREKMKTKDRFKDYYDEGLVSSLKRV